MRPEFAVRRITRAASWTGVFASALLVCACSAVQHGYRTRDVAGRTLALATPAAKERLQMELAYDGVVGDVLAEHGQPDFLHVLDRDHLYLFYSAQDLVAMVVRDGMPPGHVSEQSPIPGHFFRLLPAGEVEHIQAARAAHKAAHPVARRPPPAVAPPAARNPAPGTAALRLTGFDLETLMARFREPMSAADAGVSGWRVVDLADGARSGIARVGRTEFQIRPDVVAASTSVAGSSRGASNDARTGYVRVNRAVFGTRAHSISQGVAPFVEQVAADPSGQTEIVRRIAGRTVRITRDTQRGILVYAVHAD